ncbi:MAG: dap [Firmicutes bacterium]|nr:dap [Bacillota bacterium]
MLNRLPFLRFLTLASLLCALTLSLPSAWANQTEPQPGYYILPPYKLPAKSSPLDKQLLKIMETYKIVGLSAAIFNDNKLIWKGGYGWANLEATLPVTPGTIFRAASLSKMVTATALMQLYDQGKFALDDDISLYLGYQVRNPLYPDDKITFRHLLTHTSSILDDGAYAAILETPSQLFETAVKELLVPDGAYYDPATFGDYAPGSQFSYSNFGTGIVGALVEKLSGLSFDQYCTRYIFKPLAMDASFEPATIKNWQNIAVLYRPDTDLASFRPTKDNYQGQKPLPPEPHPLGTLAHSPAGGLRVNATDFAKFIQAHMNGGVYSGTRILKNDTADLMHNMHWAGFGLSGFYRQKGLNFHITDDLVPGKRLVGHAGEAYGLVSDAYYNPVSKQGIVFFLNGADLSAESNPYHPVETDIATALFSAFPAKDSKKATQLTAKAGAKFIMVNDRKIFLQTPVQFTKIGKSQYLFLPPLAAADVLNATLEQTVNSVTFTSGPNQVTLTSGQTAMQVNGKTMRLQSPPYLHNQQLLIPVRELAEALNSNIKIRLQLSDD